MSGTSTLRFTILGCGSSGGVPRVGGGWGACDPENPKNRRRRCSILAERQGPGGRTTVLVDTSPDLREQLLDADIKRLDAVLFTHEHADHTHGIDDLRPLVIAMRRRLPVYVGRVTGELLMSRFGYCFETPPGSQYPPILTAHAMSPGEPFTLDGPGGPLTATPLKVVHGDIDSLGFCFGRTAYIPDVSAVPDETLAWLADLDILVLDALRYMPHPSHFSLDEALTLVDRVRPKRTILTNLHTDLDYATLARDLPKGVEPAFDGMQIIASVDAA